MLSSFKYLPLLKWTDLRPPSNDYIRWELQPWPVSVSKFATAFFQAAECGQHYPEATGNSNTAVAKLNHVIYILLEFGKHKKVMHSK